MCTLLVKKKERELDTINQCLQLLIKRAAIARLCSMQHVRNVLLHAAKYVDHALFENICKLNANINGNAKIAS